MSAHEIEEWTAANKRARDAAYDEPHERVTRDKPRTRNGKGGSEMARRYWLTDKGYAALEQTEARDAE